MRRPSGCSTVPFLGPIRAAVLIGRVQTPHRFRTKRQFWAYCGLALETRDSAEYRVVNGQLERKQQTGADSRTELEPQPRIEEPVQGRRHDGQHARRECFASFIWGCWPRGCGRRWRGLTLARKIAAIALKIWKKGEPFDAEYLKPQAA